MKRLRKAIAGVILLQLETFTSMGQSLSLSFTVSFLSHFFSSYCCVIKMQMGMIAAEEKLLKEISIFLNDFLCVAAEALIIL